MSGLYSPLKVAEHIGGPAMLARSDIEAIILAVDIAGRHRTFVISEAQKVTDAIINPSKVAARDQARASSCPGNA